MCNFPDSNLIQRDLERYSEILLFVVNKWGEDVEICLNRDFASKLRIVCR